MRFQQLVYLKWRCKMDEENNIWSFAEIASMFAGAYFVFDNNYSFASMMFILAIYFKIKSFDD